MKNTKPDATIDIRDSIPPVSLLKVENRLADMQCGQLLEVFCGDQETKTDLLSIAKNAGHRCRAVSKASSTFLLLIEKGLRH